MEFILHVPKNVLFILYNITFCSTKSIFIKLSYLIQICSGITSGRVLDGELLYTKILEVNLTHPVDWREIFMKQSIGKCKQISF